MAIKGRIAVFNEFNETYSGAEIFGCEMLRLFRTMGYRLDYFGKNLAKPWEDLVDSCLSFQDKVDQQSFVLVNKMTLKGLLSLFRVPGALKKDIFIVHHDHSYYCSHQKKYHLLTNRVCQRPSKLSNCYRLCPEILMNKDRRKTVFQIELLRKELPKKNIYHVVFSDYMKQEVRANFEGAQICELPPFLEEAPFLDVEKRNKSSKNSKILFCGQLVRGKGTRFLKKIIKKVPSSYSVNILGGGKDFNFLHAELSEFSNVRLLGKVSQNQVWKEMLEASALIMPSYWPEPLGLVGIEALRAGCPVVAFDVGGISDWLEHGVNGYLARPYNLEEFLDYLFKVLEPSQGFRDKAEEISKNAKKQYSLHKALPAWKRVFEVYL